MLMKNREIEVPSKMEQITYRPIGVIRSPFKQAEGTPIQPSGAQGVAGTVELEPEFSDGLRDLDGFSHIVLVYHFHLSRGYSLEVIPFLDDSNRGIFATRAPRRPNSIGISIVRLIGIEDSKLHVQDVDIEDGTPLLDIKPYVPEFEYHGDVRIGWYSKKVALAKVKRADARFASSQDEERP